MRTWTGKEMLLSDFKTVRADLHYKTAAEFCDLSLQGLDLVQHGEEIDIRVHNRRTRVKVLRLKWTVCHGEYGATEDEVRQ